MLDVLWFQVGVGCFLCPGQRGPKADMCPFNLTAKFVLKQKRRNTQAYASFRSMQWLGVFWYPPSAPEWSGYKLHEGMKEGV